MFEWTCISRYCRHNSTPVSIPRVIATLSEMFEWTASRVIADITPLHFSVSHRLFLRCLMGHGVERASSYCRHNTTLVSIPIVIMTLSERFESTWIGKTFEAEESGF
ncbi:hypothetical protein AVEN_39136-1 [Araneus ventricosus]|uniref:Uncharacterized protein n=1 Tax=Araneus ventricosus TaxID=182803 RepID=A0A4Y2P670_ARAVE|nr:hypothetical protein AVEN_39136-1 [Araneus ventricosus]